MALEKIVSHELSKEITELVLVMDAPEAFLRHFSLAISFGAVSN